MLNRHIIFRVTYGYSVQSADDPLLTDPMAAVVNFSKATTPGNFSVDFISAGKSYYSFIIINIPVFTHSLAVKLLPLGSGFLKLVEE
jgi:hypothetical protein